VQREAIVTGAAGRIGLVLAAEAGEVVDRWLIVQVRDVVVERTLA